MDSVKMYFIENSQICQPMEIFERQPQSAELLLERCERFAAEASGRAAFYKWLAEMMDSAPGSYSFAFYGTSLYPDTKLATTDVDLLLFTNSLPLRFPPQAPPFIHQYRIYEEERVWGNETWRWKFLVAHALLLFSGSEVADRKISMGREAILSSPFLCGGIGDLITYAAFKALNKQEHAFFSPSEWNRLSGKKFKIDWRHIDFSSMLSRQITLDELHGQVREQMRLMEDKDLSALTNAAMRRLRVKRELRPELRDRFVQGIRKLKA